MLWGVSKTLRNRDEVFETGCSKQGVRNSYWGMIVSFPSMPARNSATTIFFRSRPLALTPRHLHSHETGTNYRVPTTSLLSVDAADNLATSLRGVGRLLAGDADSLSFRAKLSQI